MGDKHLQYRLERRDDGNWRVDFRQSRMKHV
jgi:hypothetical protein